MVTLQAIEVEAPIYIFRNAMVKASARVWSQVRWLHLAFKLIYLLKSPQILQFLQPHRIEK